MGFLPKNNFCRGCAYFDTDDKVCYRIGDGYTAPLRAEALKRCEHYHNLIDDLRKRHNAR